MKQENFHDNRSPDKNPIKSGSHDVGLNGASGIVTLLGGEDTNPQADWHCVQTKPKSEHIAGASLRQFEDVAVYCPRLRYQKTTRRGKVWFTEALFPGYLFARFVLEDRLRAVSHANAVSKVLRFGERYATVTPEMIGLIRSEMAGEEILTLEEQDPAAIGENAEVAVGPLQGLQGIVTNHLSGGERVRLLVEILGGPTVVEIPAESLISDKHPRDALTGFS
jgi:transcriptional antiterminator RfaH